MPADNNDRTTHLNLRAHGKLRQTVEPPLAWVLGSDTRPRELKLSRRLVFRSTSVGMTVCLFLSGATLLQATVLLRSRSRLLSTVVRTGLVRIRWSVGARMDGNTSIHHSCRRDDRPTFVTWCRLQFRRALHLDAANANELPSKIECVTERGRSRSADLCSTASTRTLPLPASRHKNERKGSELPPFPDIGLGYELSHLPQGRQFQTLHSADLVAFAADSLASQSSRNSSSRPSSNRHPFRLSHFSLTRRHVNRHTSNRRRIGKRRNSRVSILPFVSM